MQSDAHQLPEMKPYGEICIEHVCFEWTLPDFFSLILNRKEYESPEFEFCDAKWVVTIHPNRQFPGLMDFALIKRSSSYRNYPVSYKFAVLYRGGGEYIIVKDKHDFSSSDLESLKRNVVRYNKLQRVKNMLSLDETLTISCTLKCDFPITWASRAAETGEYEFLEDEVNNAEEDDVISEANGVISTVIGSGKLLRDMEALYFNGQDSDLTLIVGDRRFPVHRVILGARSPAFAAMFMHGMEEKTSGIVNITDFDPDVFHEFLLYLYAAKVEKLSWETVVGLYTAADKYDTQELKAECAEFMSENLSLNMFCSVVSVALQHNESALLETATKFFTRNFKQIILTVEWQTFLQQNPIPANELLIKASNFYVTPEE